MLISVFLVPFASAAVLSSDLWAQYGSGLSNEQLDAFVPEVKHPERAHALERFSLRAAISRIFGHSSVPPQYRLPVKNKKMEFSDETLIELRNDPYKLGLVYFWALGGVPRDLQQAIRLFESAARMGDSEAMFMLGVCYSSGLLGAVEEDQAKAQLYYSLAAQNGCLKARLALAHRYYTGFHTVANEKRAKKLLWSAGMYLLDEILGESDEASKRMTEVTAQGLLKELEGANAGMDPEPFKFNWPPVSPSWAFERECSEVYAFGSEYSTGLYGRNVYKQQFPPAPLMELNMGAASGARRFVEMLYPDEFESVKEADETLTYRAVFEEDTTAMLLLSMLRFAQHDPQGSVHWALQCVKDVTLATFDSIHASCFQVLAERVLQTQDLTPAALAQAYEWYTLGQQRPCKSCDSGKALIALRAALGAEEVIKQHPELDYEQLLSVLNNRPEVGVDELLLKAVELSGSEEPKIAALQDAFNTTRYFLDYTSGVELARRYLNENEPRKASFVLRRVQSDTGLHAPVASLMLAKQRPNNPDVMIQLTHAIESLNERYSPAVFAQRRYEQGDIESAVLGFIVSAELGISSSILNLADLIDERHSLVGSLLDSNSTIGIGLRQWPLPSFAKGNRTELALRYFLLSAAHDSADSLYKSIELGGEEVFGPGFENRTLKTLERHDFSMAYFKKAVNYFQKKNYKRSKKSLWRAMVSPEAWLPVWLVQVIMWPLQFFANGLNLRLIMEAAISLAVIAVAYALYQPHRLQPMRPA